LVIRPLTDIPATIGPSAGALSVPFAVLVLNDVFVAIDSFGALSVRKNAFFILHEPAVVRSSIDVGEVARDSAPVLKISADYYATDHKFKHTAAMRFFDAHNSLLPSGQLLAHIILPANKVTSAYSDGGHCSPTLCDDRHLVRVK
jgi:hypothetical protein